MPIDMRLPKLRGNTSADAMPIGPFRTSTQPVNLRDLEARFEAGAEVTPDALVTVGLIKNTKIDIKILGSGELTKKLVRLRARFLEDGEGEDRGGRRHRQLAARRAGREEAQAVEGRSPGRERRRERTRREAEIVEEAAPAEADDAATPQGEAPAE